MRWGGASVGCNPVGVGGGGGVPVVNDSLGDIS